VPGDDLDHGRLGPEANQVKIIVRVFAPQQNLPPAVEENKCNGSGQCQLANNVSVDVTVEAQRPNTGDAIPSSASTLPLNIETLSLPDGVQGQPYETQTIAVSGGTGPYTFAGSLPPA
jgi:hypothetical protein